MKIIGCDFHPSFQQIAVFESETGEISEHKLVNGNGDAERFYRSLPVGSLIGIEACGNSHWFIDLVGRLGHQVWVGDAAKIRASYVRKQKTDRRDAAHILTLLLEKRFPRLWTPSRQERDQRQLLIHRHKLVQIRTRSRDSLQHLALNQGVQKKQKLWSKEGQKLLVNLPLEGWTAVRRQGFPGAAGAFGRAHCQVGQGGRAGRASSSPGQLADAAEGSGTDHCPGLCPDHWRCEPFSSTPSR